MSDANSRSLSNNFQDVRLVSLASWSKAREIEPRDGGGPYVVTQEGYDPADSTLTSNEFILGRSGKWLPLGLFYLLPVAERREEFVFGRAAEVMQIVGNLTSKVIVVRPGNKDQTMEEAPADDEMAAAIKAGKQGAGATG